MKPTVYPDFHPFFSVIICTYNRNATVTDALDSLLQQTEKDWEAIIVDDGSADNTFERVRLYAEKYERIRYMYHSNRGPALTRNAGLRAANGLFITFLDSDDTYRPDHLALRREILLEYPEVEFLHGGVQIIGDPFVPDKRDPKKMIHLDKCVIGGTFVIRRDTALKIGGFPAVRYSDDSAFYQVVRKAGIPMARTDEPTYVYNRTSPDSLCNLVAQKGVGALESND